MTSTAAGSCANQPCHCIARPGDAYCCDYCKHIATSGPPREEPMCECDHTECAEQRAPAAE